MDPLAPLITALHSEGRLRVWSLIITVFGDLVQHRGGEISTARLGRLLGRVGIEQGTLRTALSRLGRDGWVRGRREGRTSLYHLTEQGVARFAPATTRIYAPPRTAPVKRWALGVRLTENGAQQVTLRPADETPEPADCRVTGDLDDLSAAYRDTFLGTAHRAALDALAGDLAALQADIAAPLDAAAARMLLIHRWRRIVLRFPELPGELMPADAPLANPRLRVAQAYGRLVAPAEAWLDSDCGGLAPMPEPGTDPACRFMAPRRG